MGKINLGGVLIMFAVSGALFVGLIWGITWLFTDDAIKTDKPIKPEIELTLKNNVIDTLYVYRKP